MGRGVAAGAGGRVDTGVPTRAAEGVGAVSVRDPQEEERGEVHQVRDVRPPRRVGPGPGETDVDVAHVRGAPLRDRDVTHAPSGTGVGVGVSAGPQTAS